jgi:hypothetical protein
VSCSSSEKKVSKEGERGERERKKEREKGRKRRKKGREKEKKRRKNHPRAQSQTKNKKTSRHRATFKKAPKTLPYLGKNTLNCVPY